MAEYPKITLTNKAMEMIAAAQIDGTILTITRVKIGDGSLAEGADIKSMTDVINSMLVAPFSSSNNDGGGQITVHFAVSNATVEAGFFAREIGVFAKLNDGEEQLYAYTNAGNKCDWIPDKHTPIDSQVIDLTLIVGNAENVTVHISDEAFALAKDLIDHNTNPKSHPHQLRPPLKRSTAYAKGDICFHDSLPSYAYLECITAGTTAESEQDFWGGRASDRLTDGTVTFIVRDMRCKYRTGQIVTIWGTPAEYDYLLLCDGSQISAELYPELVKVLGGNTLPDLVGRFLEGAGSAGEYKEAGLPNIEGEAIHKSWDSYSKAHGSNYWDKKETTGVFFSDGSSEYVQKDLASSGIIDSLGTTLKLDASKSNPIYGSSTTVQPKSMTVKYYICYAG